MSVNYKGKININSIIIITAIIVIIAVIGVFIIINKSQTSYEQPNLEHDSSQIDTQPTVDSKEKADSLPNDTQYATKGLYHGLWVDMVMGGKKASGDDLWLYENEDGTIDFEYISSDGIEFESSRITLYDDAGSFVDESRNYEGSITLKPYLVELNYINSASQISKSISFEKYSKITLTRRELFNEINSIISSKYTNINPNIFRIKDGREFLLLNLVPTCLVENRDVKSSYSGIDYIRNVYSIDKYNNKLLTISDLIIDEEHARTIDSFIKSFIEDKKQEYSSNNETWPYEGEFIGILSPYNDNSKYFYVDEIGSVLVVKILNNKNKTDDDSQDLWCSIPLYLVLDNERKSRLGIQDPIIEALSGDYSGDIGGLENVINNET